MKTTESLCSRVRGIIAVSVIVCVLVSVTGCNFQPDVSAASALPSSLAVKAKEAGVHVHLDIHEEMFHVYPLFSSFIKEGFDAIHRIASFIKQLSL